MISDTCCGYYERAVSQDSGLNSKTRLIDFETYIVIAIGKMDVRKECPISQGVNFYKC